MSPEIHLFSFQLFHLIVYLFLFIYLLIHTLRLVPSHCGFSMLCRHRSIYLILILFNRIFMYLFIHLLDWDWQLATILYIGVNKWQRKYLFEMHGHKHKPNLPVRISGALTCLWGWGWHPFTGDACGVCATTRVFTAWRCLSIKTLMVNVVVTKCL